MITEDETITPSNTLQEDTRSYSDEKVTKGSSEWSKTGRSSYRNLVGTSWPGMTTFLPAEGWGQCPRTCKDLLFHPSLSTSAHWYLGLSYKAYLSLAVLEAREQQAAYGGNYSQPSPHSQSLFPGEHTQGNNCISFSLFWDVKTQPQVQWGGAEWQKLNNVPLSPSWSLREERTGTEMTSPRYFRQTIAKPGTKNCSY